MRSPFLLILLFVVLLSSGFIADTLIDYQWWKELGQLDTWLRQIQYGSLPVLVASLLAAIALWTALARGMKYGGWSLGAIPHLTKASVVAALFAGILVAGATIDTWTVIRFMGGNALSGEAASWHDPIFGKPLSFYLFDLPFYRSLYSYLLTVTLLGAFVYWMAARFSGLQAGKSAATDARFALESGFLRFAAIIFLLALAVRYYLNRYALLASDHGFLVGIDYVDEHIRLPFQWALIVACLVSAAFVARGKWAAALLLPLVGGAQIAVTVGMGALYVRPNEISLERPYLEKHIQATRSAYALDRRVKEIEFETEVDGKIDITKHKPLLDNVRLWDRRAFHDTIQQIQALRPYYQFAGIDVDRYTVDGQLRQVLLSPRELDVRQLPDARTRWINPHFIYTHGYGLVMAEANRITTDGLPHFFVQDAPPKTKTQSLKLTRPEIYFGEMTHDPVYVRTEEKEFSYPAGNDSVFSRYEGTGGFPISSFPLRLAAAVKEVNFNIFLTSLLSGDSRMMIRRNVRARVETLAGFIHWDTDPYLVVTDDGRLVWTIDGYTLSDSHPYSHLVNFEGETVNYVRNAVKATVDAYHGTVNMYVFEPSDPLIQAYQKLFPALFQPASAMPPDIRRHARYPSAIFRAQAEIYRFYHMRDPQAFYNKEDVWDFAKTVYGKENRPTLIPPGHVVATLPGQTKEEFMLLLPFTPRGKDNLIGLMIARCDGENLGEIQVLQLSKQDLIFGPMQIQARINQEPEISKDLSLWDQKGSEVLHGQMLVLPVGKTFLYVEPIYIQASQGKMPQLKKVVVAVGNELFYRNTYEEAIAAMSGQRPVAREAAKTEAAAAPAAGQPDRRIGEIRERFRRYRELWSQGKYAEAGKEMEAIESLAGR